MSKRNYTTHRAIISIQFDVKNGDPDEVADQIVREMIDDGYPATLDDVKDVEGGSADDLRPAFVKTALEAGHGDDFMAAFVFTRENDSDEVFFCESVDLLMRRGDDSWIPIGAVGGEVAVEAVRNSDGSLNTEQMCRDWIGVWHRHFVGITEDSVLGLFLMIKQVVSEGRPTK
jgi:hypothetical protein